MIAPKRSGIKLPKLKDFIKGERENDGSSILANCPPILSPKGDT